MQRFRENGWALPSFFLADRGWAILPCLLLVRVHFPYFRHTQPMGTFAQGMSLLFRNFSAAFQFPLRTAQRISNNLWAFPTGAVSSNCPIDFKSISQRLSAKSEQYQSFSSKQLCSNS
jgi:hypothetical protein